MHRLINLPSLLMTSALTVLLLLGMQSSLAAAPARQTNPPTGDPVIVAAGDIANCSNEEDFLTGYLLDGIDGTILALGDLAYEAGSLVEFNNCYGPSWGRHKDRTKPAPGNHEYGTQGAEGYYTYWGDVATPLEPGCKRDCGGYYSFDVGAWHIVSLNSEIDTDPGSPQEQWLRADLAANPTACTLAYWHKPRVSSVRNDRSAGHGLFQAMYEYGADVLLVGHDHAYERFMQVNPSLQPDPERGIREFIVGTGGAELYDFRFIQPTSEARNSETWGVLKMTLHPTSYDWEFIPIPGQTFTDSGSAPCVTVSSVPPAPVGVLGVSTAPVTTAPVTTAPVTTAPVTTAPITTAPVTPSPVTTAGAAYTIKAGDTLYGIAVRNGLDWTVLALANQLTESSVLQIGQVIRLPGVQASSAPVGVQASSAPVAAPVVSAQKPVTSPVATTNATATTSVAASGRTHTVVSGDTVFAIAIANGADWQEVLQLNGMTESSILQIGQVIRLP